MWGKKEVHSELHLNETGFQLRLLNITDTHISVTAQLLATW